MPASYLEVGCDICLASQQTAHYMKNNLRIWSEEQEKQKLTRKIHHHLLIKADSFVQKIQWGCLFIVQNESQSLSDIMIIKFDWLSTTQSSTLWLGKALLLYTGSDASFLNKPNVFYAFFEKNIKVPSWASTIRDNTVISVTEIDGRRCFRRVNKVVGTIPAFMNSRQVHW